MKKLLIIFALSSPFWGLGGYAQSLQIGSNFVILPNSATAPVCAIADKGKQYFNSTDNKMYFCNGTAWVDFSTGAFTLPYSGIGSSDLATRLFQITQTGDNSAGVFRTINATNSVTTLYSTTNGTNFAGLFESTNATPKALRTIGALQFQGIGQGTGKVLTSDANGNATWTGVVAFKSHLTSGPTINNGIVLNAINFAQDFDLGNNYVGGFFTAPVAGVYHFDVSVKWSSSNTTPNYVEANLDLCDNAGANCVNQAKNQQNDEFSPQQTFGVDVLMAVGEKVKVSATQTGVGSRAIVASNSSFFSGHFVR